MSNFRPTDRLTGYLMPPSVDEWLPPRHLARFVVEVVESLDLTAMSTYRGSGSASYPPATLLSVLIYGYATGVFSSRKLERSTYDSVGKLNSGPVGTRTTLASSICAKTSYMAKVGTTITISSPGSR